jgi:hypothetical protein
MKKLIATRGNQRLYETHDGRGVTEDTRTGLISAPLNIQSVLARGYWQPVSVSDPNPQAQAFDAQRTPPPKAPKVGRKTRARRVAINSESAPKD